MNKYILRFYYKNTVVQNFFHEEEIIIVANTEQDARLHVSGMIQLDDGSIPGNWDRWTLELQK